MKNLQNTERQINPAQEAAIHHGSGPCAVIAGPGSGKTYVLTRRIRDLIENRGAAPSSILVLTFSRAAAVSMRTRFLRECSSSREGDRHRSAAGSEVTFGTFHSVFFQILQASSEGRLRLISPASKRAYLQHLCSLQPYDMQQRDTGREQAADRPAPADWISPGDLQLLISRFKNGLPCRQSWLAGLVREYDAYLQSRGWIDFDDMILRCRDLLRKDPDTLHYCRDRFTWILVDEFQDVSRVQYEVLLMLAAPRNNLFVVGDDDQSIYGFRGSAPETMQQFLADFSLTFKNPGRERDGVIFLTTNYRSCREILRASAALIRDNKRRIDKKFQCGSSGRGFFACRTFTEKDLQYAFLAEELASMQGAERRQTAVIFRTHAGTRQFLDLLKDRGIPFLAEGRRQRNQQQSEEETILEDLAAYYRTALLLGASGAPAFDRLETAPVSCGGKSPAAGPRPLLRTGHPQGARRKDLLRIMNRPERFLSGSFLTEDTMDAGQMIRHAGFDLPAVQELLRDLSLLDSLSPSWSLRYLLDSMGYRQYALQAFRDPDPLLQDLVQKAAEYRTSSAWLSYLTQSHSDSHVSRQDKTVPPAPGEAVHILTMHACKGLEFDRVFIPDLNEGNVPSRRALTPEEIEEERRLLYVAMTRARRCLTLTCLEGTSDRPAAPSRFLHMFL